MSEASETAAVGSESSPIPLPLAGLRCQVWPAILSVLLLTFATGARMCSAAAGHHRLPADNMR
jgi:hypothetical protein